MGINITLTLIILLFFTNTILYTFQIAFWSATLVVFSSMASYRRMVNARLEHQDLTSDRDALDKIEDSHDLYSEEIQEKDGVNFAETIKEEKKRQKMQKRSVGETIKDSKGAISLYRIGAYFLLVLGFFYLNNHNLLHIPTYIFALGLPIVVIIWRLLHEAKHSTI